MPGRPSRPDPDRGVPCSRPERNATAARKLPQPGTESRLRNHHKRSEPGQLDAAVNRPHSSSAFLVGRRALNASALDGSGDARSLTVAAPVCSQRREQICRTLHKNARSHLTLIGNTGRASGLAGDAGWVRCRRPCRRRGCSSGGGPGSGGPVMAESVIPTVRMPAWTPEPSHPTPSLPRCA